jgi:hypothetical protein
MSINLDGLNGNNTQVMQPDEQIKEKHKEFIGKPLPDPFPIEFFLEKRDRLILDKYGAWLLLRRLNNQVKQHRQFLDA